MSYFDHVRCTACKAMIDPEAVAVRPGQGMSCPRCGAPLSLGDLFGLKDAFQEEEGEDPSFDDLVPRGRSPAAAGPAAVGPGAGSPRGAAVARPGQPSGQASPSARSAAPSRPARAPEPSSARRSAPALPGPAPAPAASAASPPQDSGEESSAMAAMKALKRKK